MALNHKYTLICDDVRQENTNKFILIGVYTGVIGVTSIPIVMPMGLTFFQAWEADRPGQEHLKLKIQHLETGQTIIEARAGLNIIKPGVAVVPLRLGPIQFSAVGTYNLVVEIEGQKDPTIVDFVVQLNLMNPQMGAGPSRTGI